MKPTFYIIVHGCIKYNVDHIAQWFEIIISLLINTHPGSKPTTLTLHRNKMQRLACQLTTPDFVVVFLNREDLRQTSDESTIHVRFYEAYSENKYRFTVKKIE